MAILTYDFMKKESNNYESDEDSDNNYPQVHVDRQTSYSNEEFDAFQRVEGTTKNL